MEMYGGWVMERKPKTLQTMATIRRLVYNTTHELHFISFNSYDTHFFLHVYFFCSLLLHFAF